MRAQNRADLLHYGLHSLQKLLSEQQVFGDFWSFNPVLFWLTTPSTGALAAEEYSCQYHSSNSAALAVGPRDLGCGKLSSPRVQLRCTVMTY